MSFTDFSPIMGIDESPLTVQTGVVRLQSGLVEHHGKNVVILPIRCEPSFWGILVLDHDECVGYVIPAISFDDIHQRISLFMDAFLDGNSYDLGYNPCRVVPMPREEMERLSSRMTTGPWLEVGVLDCLT